MRQSLILTVIISIASFIAAPLHTIAAEPPRPNIILIMADDLGWADTGFNGNTVIHTASLDKLAAEGMVFDRFYAAAPVCSPTRGSCLTGRHPMRYGVNTANAGHMRDDEITLAEVLKKQGYRTGHFGKWHLGTLTKTVKESNRGGPRGEKHYAPPWNHGFDTCFSTEAKTPTHDPMLQPKNNNSRTWWDPVANEEDALAYNTHYWTGDGEMVHDNLRGDDSRVIMDRALAFMKEAADEDKPFFAVIWFHTPHLPVVAGEKYTKRYEGHEKYAQHYYGCITAMDEQVGRLADALRANKQWNNTMTWFCSDNGPEGKAGNAPGSAGILRGRKRDLYEGGIRVPAFVVWPGHVKKQTRTTVPAVTSDYLPTIMAALDLPPIDGRIIDGQNILPIVLGDTTRREKPIGFHHGNRKAWMEGNYKAVSYPGGDWQLFDLVNDPGEKRDLAGEDPDRTKKMANAWRKWKETF